MGRVCVFIGQTIIAYGSNQLRFNRAIATATATATVNPIALFATPDDGSRYFHDSLNFAVFGGAKNFIGAEKNTSNNYYLYPEFVSKLDGEPGGLKAMRAWIARSPLVARRHKDSPSPRPLDALGKLPFCVDSLRTDTTQFSGFHETWADNTCVTTAPQPYFFDFHPCSKANHSTFPKTARNRFLVPEGHRLQFPVCVGRTPHHLLHVYAELDRALAVLLSPFPHPQAKGWGWGAGVLC